MNFIFSAAELQAHKRRPCHVPQQGGPKEFAPNGSEEQNARLQSTLSDYNTVLGEERVVKRSNVSVGVWNPEKKIVEVSSEKGPFWLYMGRKVAGTMLVYPEEALFLIEQGALEVYHGGLPISLQQAFTTLLPQTFNLDCYMVYAYLLRLGFIVLRHKKWQDRENTKTTAAKSMVVNTPDCVDKPDMADAHTPPTGTPVPHLWMGQEGCVPLARPTDATSTASLLSKLQVVKTQRMKDIQLTREVMSHKLVFDVYQPGSNFRKSEPECPDFTVCVCRFCDPPPSLGVTSQLYKEANGVPVKFAVVDGGSISFYSLLDSDLPTFITTG